MCQIVSFIFRIAQRFGISEGTFISVKTDIITILVEKIFPEVVRWPKPDELREVARKMALNRKSVIFFKLCLVWLSGFVIVKVNITRYCL